MTPTDAPDVDLPPLPEPRMPNIHSPRNPGTFLADQMQAYALQAVLAERLRIATSVDAQIANWEGPFKRSGELIAAAIRGEKK